MNREREKTSVDDVVELTVKTEGLATHNHTNSRFCMDKMNIKFLSQVQIWYKHVNMFVVHACRIMNTKVTQIQYCHSYTMERRQRGIRSRREKYM